MLLRGAYSTVAFLAIMAYGRLLDPVEFGLMAMATTGLAFIGLCRDLGLAASAIQRRELSNTERDELFWLNGFAALLATGLLIAAAPALAAFYGESALVAVLLGSALSFTLWGLQGQHAAQLRRHMQFRALLRAEGFGVVAGFVVGVGVALVRHDVWALVAANTVQALVTSLLIFLADPWKPKWRGTFSNVKHTLRWSRDYSSQNILNYFSANWGQIIIGNQHGPVELGIFNRALQIFTFPNSMLMGPLIEVFTPLLSRAQESRSEFSTLYLGLLSRAAMLFFTLAALLPIISHSMVNVLLGPRWEEAAVILACFAPALAALGVVAPAQVALTAQGKVGLLRNWSIADFLCRAAGATTGLYFGAKGVAAGASVLGFLLTAPAILVLVASMRIVSLADQLKCLLPAAIVAAAAAVTGLVIEPLIANAMHYDLFVLLGTTAAGFVAGSLVGMVIPASRGIILGTVQAVLGRPRLAT
jgi:PST family polysaccharide transporter